MKIEPIFLLTIFIIFVRFEKFERRLSNIKINGSIEKSAKNLRSIYEGSTLKLDITI